MNTKNWKLWIFSDLGILIIIAVARVIIQSIFNSNYGFHRDELATIDDARYLAWGYTAYPPFTPAVARLALELFGPSLVGLRLFAALAQGGVTVLTGLMARELGGGRFAQVVAALAVTVTPFSLVAGSLFQYVTFDYLFWVLIAYLVIRLLKSGDARWWLGIGAVIGLGAMNKYTIAFYIAGVVVGVLVTGRRPAASSRQFLKSPWLWAGVGLALLIFLPNLIWQVQHDFISLEFLASIHERDVRIGRTAGFLTDQFLLIVNPLTIALWAAGLHFYLFAPDGKPYRMLGWMFLVPLVLLLIFQGRGYYLMPAYPMLVAAGAARMERWLITLPAARSRSLRATTWRLLGVVGLVSAVLSMPVAPVNSTVWSVASELNENVVEEIGWPELVETVAGIYHNLPEGERSTTGILTGNYGEAGAVNLFGPAYGLPEAISGINSYWLRGFGNPPPKSVIVLGLPLEYLSAHFQSCEPTGRITNRYGVENEETEEHPDIYLCRSLKLPWPDFWQINRRFG